MKNLAGTGDSETARLELKQAGINVFNVAGQLGECKLRIVGVLDGWLFTRAWYYWVAQGWPGLPLKEAKKLHSTNGTEVRVVGHCGCPAPDIWINSEGCIDVYHIDTQEGLNTFADTIRSSQQ